MISQPALPDSVSLDHAADHPDRVIRAVVDKAGIKPEFPFVI